MSKQALLFLSLLLSGVIACSNDTGAVSGSSNPPVADPVKDDSKKVMHFRGALSGGMKGDSIFFDISADGKRLENLMFKGYWYCDGKLTRENAAGPEGFFTLENGKVNSHISEPPNGGATAWRFDLSATVVGKKASGTFRMNINALRCNTGTLSWEAAEK